MHMCLKYLFNIAGLPLNQLAVAVVAMTIWSREKHKKHRKQLKNRGEHNERKENNLKARKEMREEEPSEKEEMVSNPYLFGAWICQLATLCSQR